MRQVAVWCDNGELPRPEIRLKQGKRLRVAVENGLATGTTVSQRRMRMPNTTDGARSLF
tara:strand:+ start:6204 stop:6380 length:177 start_codon:yes stop_codon:yes gene_type:complete